MGKRERRKSDQKRDGEKRDKIERETKMPDGRKKGKKGKGR